MTASIERRLEDLEAKAEPPKGWKITTMKDLMEWSEMGGDIPPDLSEASDDFLRMLYDATKDDEGGGPDEPTTT